MPQPDDLTDVRTGPLPTDPVATYAELLAMLEDPEANEVVEGDVSAQIRERHGFKAR